MRYMRRPPPAGLKASAGATKPSTQRVPGGLDMDNINLTNTLDDILVRKGSIM